ncbi:MAG: proton-conducting transporter membrane subunit [Candidatus Altiarchaeota archaeon]
MNILAHTPALIIAIQLLSAFSVSLVEKFSKKLRDAFVFFAITTTLILVLILSSDVLINETKVYVFGASSPQLTLPSGYKFPIRIIFEIDAMSIFMAIIIAIISFVSVVYSLRSMEKHIELGKYYCLLFLLTAAMFGMVFTADLFNFFVFLEISSVASCALIAFRIDRKFSSEAAFKTMVILSISALLFLLGIAILYSEYDALNIAYISSKISFSNLDKIALVLFSVSLLMKLGAIPLHFWLPDAYSQAPSAITILLVVNSQVGLYALFRICFALYGLKMNTALIGAIIIIFGLLSMFIGVTMALIQKSIKKLMAYHAISQTGYMLLSIGVGLSVLGTPAMEEYGITAMKGGIFHIINHALYKGLLFLTAGAIIYSTGMRNLDNLSGLAHKMKFTTIFFMIGAAAITGLPPFNGFASKLLIYESVYRYNPILSIVAMFVSLLTLASFVKVFQSAFLGPKLKFSDNLREVPKSMLIAMLILASLIILFGIFPNLILENLVEPAVNSLINKGAYIEALEMV